MFRRLLETWSNRNGALRHKAQRRTRGKQPRSYRPRVESLENRTLMAVAGSVYLQTNLISDQADVAAIQDTSLVNAWGLAIPPTGGNFWIADNGTNVSSVYGGNVNQSPLTKNLADVTLPGDGVTGVVFNSTTDFVIDDGNGHSGPAAFIFVSEDGTVSGWNPNVPPPPPSTAAQVGTTVAGAIYKGVAIGNNGTENLIYAANFHTGHIDVFDTNFDSKTLSGNFTDPNLPKGYAPFNVQNIGGTLYVTYAKQDAAKEDEVAGPGKGFVDRFDTNGRLLSRFASGGVLNAPWGVAKAPANFGRFSGDILVGNFGDGRIEAFKVDSHGHSQFQGFLQDASGRLVQIDGLWALGFGNGTTAGDANALYFTAGPDDEAHGLFGKLAPATNLQFAGQVFVTAKLTSRNFNSGQFTADLTIHNVKKSSIAGPITVVLDNFPAGATLTNADGTTADGKPFFTLSGPLAGKSKTTISVEFTASSRRDFGRAFGSLFSAAVVQGEFG
jgi:uncharacterized protein (TIGR03118 family)